MGSHDGSGVGEDIAAIAVVRLRIVWWRPGGPGGGRAGRLRDGYCEPRPRWRSRRRRPAPTSASRVAAIPATSATGKPNPALVEAAAARGPAARESAE